jgi:beta-lactamase class A
MIGRRGLMGMGAALAAGPLAEAGQAAVPEAGFAAIEAATGGRLGVAVLDGVGGRLLAGHRAEALFPMCSTFKLLAAAAVLARADRGQDRLERRIVLRQADMVPYAPVTSKRLGGEGMTLAELCEAAVTLSDNPAANALLASLGGPQGLTDFARAIGDSVTRLDRTEPTLNEALPGDPRDTTSPLAMAGTIRRLVLGEVLAPASRERLAGWLLANRTGDRKLRAGLPAGWRAAEKTGSGANGTSNDAGVLFPPGRPPLVVAVYLTGATVPEAGRDAAIAAVAREVVARLG